MNRRGDHFSAHAIYRNRDTGTKESTMELKGSKTEKNLMEAFAGESMARSKYTFFASVAKGRL